VSGGEDFSVRVWELATGKLEATLKGHTNYIKTLAVMPDGRKIVSGSFDRTVRVWTP
jgi:WD40 repeat protein